MSTSSLPNLKSPPRTSSRRALTAYTPDADALLPDITEININPVILRKGYLNFMEETSRGWVKRWVVSHIFACYMITMGRITSFALSSACLSVFHIQAPGSKTKNIQNW